MSTHKRTVSITLAVVLFSLLIAAAYAKEVRRLEGIPLGIEIALSKPFYVPAATGDKITKIVIRVPTAVASNPGQDAVSAIKLEPRMEGDKVRVNVYALSGDTDNIKSCADWDSLKSTRVGSYLAALDEEVSLVKLRDYGVSFGNEPLIFRAVPKRVLSPLPSNPSGGCECATCAGLICCPNPGYCLGCGSCGDVCCSGG